MVCRNVNIDFSNVKVIEDGEKLALNGRQKLVIAYTILMVVMFVAPTFLPADFFVVGFLNALGYPGILALVAILMSVTTWQGEPIMDIGEAMRKNVIWDMFFMLAAAWTLASALVAESVGISATINTVLTPLFAGKSAFVFVTIVLFAGLIITNCINNVVTMTLMLPITMGFVTMIDFNPAVVVTLFVVVLTQGAILPSGSPLGALMHGYREWLRPKDVIIYAAIFVFSLCAVAAFIGYPLGSFIFNTFA